MQEPDRFEILFGEWGIYKLEAERVEHCTDKTQWLPIGPLPFPDSEEVTLDKLLVGMAGEANPIARCGGALALCKRLLGQGTPDPDFDRLMVTLDLLQEWGWGQDSATGAEKK